MAKRADKQNRNVRRGARGEQKNKFNIAAYTEDLTAQERARLYSLMKQTKFRKKSDEEKREQIVKLKSLVKSNLGRREYESTFARNVNFAWWYEKKRQFRVRWKTYTFFIVGGIVLLLTAYLLYSYVLVVDNIEVTGSERYLYEDVVELCGINIGDKLFSPFLDTDAASRAIIDRYSYIKEVNIKRHIPDTIEIELIEEEPVFVAELYDKYVVLSEEMRVLELSKSKPNGDFITLRLPSVREAIAGRELVMDGDMLLVVKRAAEAVCSERMRDEVTVLDVSDRFNISISYGGRFRLELGTITDLDIKLTLAFEIMGSDLYAGGNKGIIYLDNVTRPSGIVDNEVDLS